MENEEKWTAGEVVAAGFLGVSAIVAAPVLLLAWLGTKGLEALGVENTPSDWDPSDPADYRNSNY